MKIIVSQELTKCDLPLVPSENFTTGIDTFRKRFADITSLEKDILTLSAAIYATDLGLKRDEREDYIRDIKLCIEVVNIHAFERVKEEIEHALYILSNDNWDINFKPQPGSLEKTNSWPLKKGVTLLFSGGIDSLCAAVDYINKKTPLLLVSHVTHNRIVEEAQVSLKKELENFYKREIDRIAMRIHVRSHKNYPFPKDSERENSQRTRSFLFLAIAALAARREGLRKIITIAENGQFAINLPLTAARAGPFSTHTAHPEFIHVMEKIFRTLLSCNDLSIVNPYTYKTKHEVISTLPKELVKIIPYSVSCWRGHRLRTRNHCGECIPCLVRRIALESAGIKLDEYEKDLFNENISSLSHDDNGKRNLMDLIEFVSHFYHSSLGENENLLEDFPELCNDHFDQDQVIAMYKRFSKEAMSVFEKYLNIKSHIK